MKGQKPALEGVSGVSSGTTSTETQDMDTGLDDPKGLRGLPGKSVDVLRSWLFEHFLDPFPTKQQKQELAQASGLEFAQVANWFITARVRIWKPTIAKVSQFSL